MFSGAIEKITNSIFPIFFTVREGPKARIGVSGTGFFIDNKGLFITANHVITDVPANSKLLYLGSVPHKIIQPIEFMEIYKDTIKDFFIGRVERDFLPEVLLAESKPKIGQSICLCGYPMAKISQNQDGSINVRNVRKYWQPTFVIDYMKANIKGKLYEGFITQHTSLRGMSGGPVFSSDGLVYGIDVATTTREIPNPNGIPTVVNNGIVAGIEEIKEAIEKIK